MAETEKEGSMQVRVDKGVVLPCFSFSLSRTHIYIFSILLSTLETFAGIYSYFFKESCGGIPRS